MESVRTMAMITWAGGNAGVGPGNIVGNWRVFIKLGDFVDPEPSNTFLLMDQREDAVHPTVSFDIDMEGYPNQPQLQRCYDMPAMHHQGATNLSFADGHNERRRWLDPRTTPPLMPGGFAPAGWSPLPSPNNADVRWLQDRATRAL